MPALIECVPNFSEGRDPEIIRRISDALGSVGGATLLHVDPGKATHRTVMTVAGAPEAVVEAAFRAIKVAGELIDMRQNILPILEAGGVDLVLAGHSHSYERSYLIDGTYSTPTPSFATLEVQGHILDDGDGKPTGDGAYQKAAGTEPPRRGGLRRGRSRRSQHGRHPQPSGHVLLGEQLRLLHPGKGHADHQ